jgi:diaminohydroxyphosphoribosylaminopyrimidine deaminase / 5-amino-6-(5-phosphoribosylamino)uracil reductase
MSSQINAGWMARAIELAKLGYPAPNPHVGCVIEREGKLLGEGFHDHAGGPHAEIAALEAAGGQAAGATVYTTQEPCNHFGRTGPCSLALIEAKVERVVMATRDPNPVGAGGADRLREAGIKVIEGVMEEEAEQANIMWLTATRRRWPYIVGKSAISMDGRTALPSGESKWITGEESRREAHVLRAECGAVLVGRRTVEKDDPELTVRHLSVVNQPLRVILDRDRQLGPPYKAFNAEAPYLRVVQLLEEPNELEVMVEEERFLLDDLVQKLFLRGVTSLLVEGGAETLSGFLRLGLIDRLELFVAPKLFGQGTPWATFGLAMGMDQVGQWRFSSARKLGDDLWITVHPSVRDNGNHPIGLASNL